MDAILSGPTEHCHASDPNLFPVIDLKNKIKKRAADSEEPSSTILHSALRSFPLDSAGRLPRNDTLLRSIRRQREAEPTNLDKRLPDHLKQTDRWENFVLHEDDKLIVFTTTSNLSVLKTCKHWFADGTFKVKEMNYFFLLDYINFRCVRTIFIKCSRYMDCSDHKLFHWFTVCSLGRKLPIMISSLNLLWKKMISILNQY